MRHRRPPASPTAPVQLPADLFDLTYDGPCQLPGGACANPSECGRQEACVHAPVHPAPAQLPLAKSISRADQERAAAAAQVAGWVGKHKARKRRGIKGAAAADRARYLALAQARIDSGEWEGATANELVALTFHLHRHVYGVDDGDLLVPKEWALAAMGAGRFRDEQFKGDVVGVVEFLRWAWAREEYNEKRRRESGTEARRLGWRLLFSTRIVTDYRLAKARGVA